MAGTFMKWLIPGLITVVGGTALAVSQTGAAITSDLGTRTVASLGAADLAWAHVEIEGRDAVLSGTATTQQMIDDAAARVSAVYGVRAVESNVALAEFVSPFPFTATIKDGKTVLAGAYPNETVHAALLGAAAGATDQTKLFSGAPDNFESAARFGLAALGNLDDGEIKLADLSLSIEGRAKSIAAFDTLQTLSQSVPPGVQLAALTVQPPLASPYVWTAKFDGTAVTISGNAPTADFAEQLRALAPANVPVSTSLALASGEPSGFADNALTLLKSLLTLERGEIAISDGKIVLSGAPSTAGIADAVTSAVTGMGGTATLEPPRIADFAFGIEKSGDKLIFSGFVPDPATRDKLAALDGADVDKLALGRGAPDRFASAVDFGLEALGHLADGQFGIKGGKMSIGGRAGTIADFKAVSDIVGQGAPQGLSLAAAEVHPPVADPFTWSAVKDASGKTTLTGFVPDETARKTIVGNVADLAADKTEPADGAPQNFAPSAAKGLEILMLLDSGSVTFDGSNWAIEGEVDNTTKGFAADAAYSIAGLRTAGWTYQVHLPKPPAAASLPTIAPYVWRAQKAPDGALGFSGFVPSDAFQRVARSRAPQAADSTVLGAGAPSDFGTSALAGLDALMALDEGSLGLNGNRWTLIGTIAGSGTRESIQNRLSGQINAANWQIAIQAKDSAPVVAPYLWAATKANDGSIELSGYVPSKELQAEATGKAGSVSRDTTAIASGEPAGFAEDLRAGLDALQHLSSGRAAYDGSKWSLSGEIANAADGDAATAALTKGSNAGALWSNAIAGYPPAPSSEPSSAPSSAPEISSAEPSSAPSSEPTSSSEPVASSEEPSASSAPESSSESSAPPPASSSEEPANREVAPTSLDVTPPMPPVLTFQASRLHGGEIALEGAVPADAAAKYFAGIAGNVSADRLVVTPNLPDDFITNAIAGIEALTTLGDGQLGFDGTRWFLRGKADQQSVKDAIDAKIAALPRGGQWSVALDLLAPLDVCKDRVAALAGRNAIVFESGKAKLAKTSLPVLDELAGDLEICPDSYVHVQGHTDADGDADGNLALSVSRAEAVVAALIDRGVAESRLYAEGYGESEPIAANDTKENKQRNRRIAFEIDEK